MNTDKIRKYATGNFSKKYLTHYIMPVGVIIPLICICIAWLLLPIEQNYNIFDKTISHLGSRDNNPFGWYFLSISLMVWAVTLFCSFL